MCYNKNTIILFVENEMCFITYNFIGRAKWEMGSLGFRPKDNNGLLNALNENICDNLMRIKDIQNTFYMVSHYQWIRKHLKKISKSMQHPKWDEVEYSKCDVKRSKYAYNNVVVVTNIFSNKFNCIHLDDDLLILEEFKIQKSNENKFEFIKYNGENAVFVFEKAYIKSINNKKMQI